MTFSIAARCPTSGMLGVAVSTAVPSVGAVCPFVRADVGAVATQSWVNPYLGLDSLDLLTQGLSPQAVINQLLSADPGREIRQLGIVDANGTSAAYSGAECVDYYGHFTGDGVSIQGNMLVGELTLTAMREDFATSADLELWRRLMSALAAGQQAGGDKRGRQSAAIKIYHREAYPYLDLRVDDHAEPVAELARVCEVWQRQMRPFVDMMATRTDPVGGHDQSVVDFILLSRVSAETLRGAPRRPMTGMPIASFAELEVACNPQHRTRSVGVFGSAYPLILEGKRCGVGRSAFIAAG